MRAVGPVMAEHACIVDFPLADAKRRVLTFGAPRKLLVARTTAEVRGVLTQAEHAAQAGAWVAGFVSYEAAPAFEPACRVRGPGPLPLAWFGVYDTAQDTLPMVDARVQCKHAWQASIPRSRFDADLASIQRAIGNGDVYQVNHSLRLTARFDDDPLGLFMALRNAQPQGYCAYLDLGRYRVLSTSPELFFRRDGGQLLTKPMKGTARRGRWPDEDDEQAQWLQRSDKNRAENVMIVDLLRNDLSRIAAPHSVRVPSLFSIERYPTLLQMTSTVTAQVRPGTTLAQIFTALFPCGSITGAPKIKAMEFIAALETEPRGVYCGAIGLIAPGGDAVFNVAIRTVTLDTQSAAATCGVGAGIVWDSATDEEYAEVLLKSRFLGGARPDFQLIETMRLDQGRYGLLDRHLQRLARSAAYFGHPFDEEVCRRLLDAVAAQHPDDVLRARLTLDASGVLDIRIGPVPPTFSMPVRVALAAAPVCRDDAFLFHKTSRRAVYEDARATRPEVFDVLLWNEDGELTEFTKGNLVLEMGALRYTPPVGCGLLDGTLRRELVELGSVRERVLHQADLSAADRVLFINSLRGEIEVFLDPALPQLPSGPQ